MTAISPSLNHEVSDLVLEQIHLFKQPFDLSDSELLEYHLRHLQIMTLYRELDEVARKMRQPLREPNLADFGGHYRRAIRNRASDNHDLEPSYRPPAPSV